MASTFVSLVERGLGSGPITNPLYSDHKAYIARVIATICACFSLLAGVMAFYWFTRMKRKFRHTLIMTLILADLFKDVNYVVFSIVAFVTKGAVTSTSPYCQASGFMIQFGTEMTDMSVLALTVHMSLQVLTPTSANMLETGLERYKYSVFAFIIGFPLLTACLAFINSGGGYALTGAYCSLPVRPFWYRLFLGWVPRYLIVIILVCLSIMIRIRVKNFQQALEKMEPPSMGDFVAGEQLDDDVIDEEDETDDLSTPEEEKPPMVAAVDEKAEPLPAVPLMPEEHREFDSEYLKKFKRSSYRRKQLPPINTNGQADNAPRTASVGAFSAAPSSAVFSSPVRDTFHPDMQYLNSGGRRRSIVDMPQRRQSIAVVEHTDRNSVSDIPPMPVRRASVVDMTPRTGSLNRNSAALGTDRFNSIGATSRRSSIWDEIDASLEKKVTNRLSVFTAGISEAEFSVSPADEHSPERRGNKRFSRQSKVYNVARRTMSIVSFRQGTEADEAAENDPAAILRRRHRYIKRQLRYLMVYPIVYFFIWLFPFVLHSLQYSDYYAAHPPFAMIVLNLVSMTSFGFVNSLVFCLREKPWTMIPDSDGTVWGSIVTFPLWFILLDVWDGIRGVGWAPDSPEMKSAEVRVVNDSAVAGGGRQY